MYSRPQGLPAIPVSVGGLTLKKKCCWTREKPRWTRGAESSCGGADIIVVPSGDKTP
jgi:hypothetical protein